MKLSLLPKLVEKLVWVPFILFCKISFPVSQLMPYYAEIGRSRPPNRLTLRITLLHEELSNNLSLVQNLKAMPITC